MNAEQLYKLLHSQQFYNFYIGPFENHLVGDEGSKSKEEIIEQLDEMISTFTAKPKPKYKNACRAKHIGAIRNDT